MTEDKQEEPVIDNEFTGKLAKLEALRAEVTNEIQSEIDVLRERINVLQRQLSRTNSLITVDRSPPFNAHCVIDLLSQNVGQRFSGPEIMEAFGYNQHNASTFLNPLVKAGDIQREGKKRGVRYFIKNSRRSTSIPETIGDITNG